MGEEILDLPEFLERVQDDKELLLELLDIYQNDFQQKRKLLADALAANKFEDIRGIAHSLKGASGNISAKALRVIFFDLEEMGKTQNIVGYQKHLSDLDAQYVILQKRIEQIKKEFAA